MIKNFFNGKIKLILTSGISLLFILVVFSNTVVKSANKKDDFPVIEFIGFAQQNANITVYSNWVDVPGIIINFTLPKDRYVDFRAIGCVFTTPSDIASFRFVVDGVAYGDPINGDLYIGGTQACLSWNIERIISLLSGEHTVKLQARCSGQFTSFYFDYSAAKLFVQAW